MEAQINCLATHPSRPHLCVSGAQAGSVAVWDLRFTARPTCHAAPEAGAGEVWEVRLLVCPAAAGCLQVMSSYEGKEICSEECVLVMQVHFDPYEPLEGSAAAPDPSVLFCTSGGILGSLQTGAGGGKQAGQAAAAVLYKEAGCGIESFDVERTLGQDIFCATEQECLVYLSRSGK